MTENEISAKIIGAAIEVHRVLGGPGLLESIYEEALCQELIERGLQVERQKIVPVLYKGKELASPLRVDILVQGKVIVECKATERYNSIYESQALTYLRLSNLRLALVINFGEKVVKDGIKRVVNNL
ncbi:MAG: GxxExxY protein [Ignavibacteria bacterium]|nr:GxxExxY protein [Ignavibacteria bacterium]